MSIDHRTIAAVVPAYQTAETIQAVVGQMPACVDWIIVVDDASSDGSGAALEQLNDPRLVYLRHEHNQGVGGAMITGFRRALELDADLVAKVDGDGQMDCRFLETFARAAIVHNCDYVKANRFGHLRDLGAMPKARLYGNIGLTFLTKFASGYWNVFDPQNGYVMISRRALRRLDLDRLDRGYFFENSMLINLNIIKARIAEIYLPARYGDETSSMRLHRILVTFPLKLMRGFLYRVYQKYVFRSVSPVAILLFCGLLLMAWGVLWGARAWYLSIASGVAATTGTVVLALLPLLVGWSSVLQAVVFDVQDAGPCLLFDPDDETLQPDAQAVVSGVRDSLHKDASR